MMAEIVALLGRLLGCTVCIRHDSLYRGAVDTRTGEKDERGPCGCHLGPEACRLNTGEAEARGRFCVAYNKCKKEAIAVFKKIAEPVKKQYPLLTGYDNTSRGRGLAIGENHAGIPQVIERSPMAPPLVPPKRSSGKAAGCVPAVPAMTGGPSHWPPLPGALPCPYTDVRKKDPNWGKSAWEQYNELRAQRASQSSSSRDESRNADTWLDESPEATSWFKDYQVGYEEPTPEQAEEQRRGPTVGVDAYASSTVTGAGAPACTHQLP